MSQGDSKGKQRSLKEKKRNRGGREATSDGTSSHWAETFQFGDIGNA